MILMYHYLGAPPPAGDPHRALTVPPEEFRAHLDMIARMNRRTVTGNEYLELLTRGQANDAVWITFDDGRIDNYETAFPALMERGMRATFFVVTEWALGSRPGYIPLSALNEMAAVGMEIGSHSLSHPRLARLPEPEMRREVSESKQRLEDALGVEVGSFCYPYGNSSDSVVAAVQSAGYRLAVSTIRDNRNHEGDRWLLRRAMVQPGRTGLRFKYLFTPLYHVVHERKNRRRWKPIDN